MNIKQHASNPILGIFLRSYKVVVSFVLIVSFFFFYNTFLIDHTLESLKFSLEASAEAYTTADLEGVDILLDRVMIDEIAPDNVDLSNVGNMEYIRNAIRQKKDYRVMDNVVLSLDTIIKQKESKRNPLLRIADAIVRFLKQVVSYIFNIIRSLVSKEAVMEKEGMIDTSTFEQGQLLEKKGDFAKALESYGEFLKKYPSFEKAGIVKIRMGNIYQRMGQDDKAASLYKEVIKTYVGKKDVYIAQILLLSLQRKEKLLKKESALLNRLSEISKDNIDELQSIYYQLGVVNLQLLKLEDAKKFFRRAVSVNPDSDIGVKARFNTAWIEKELNNLEASAAEFAELNKSKNSSGLLMDSRYQMADVLHKQGRYQEAIDIYLQLAEEYKDDPVAALCLFQAGASYMYDLNDDAKAKAIFAKLAKLYPKSPYSRYVSPGTPLGMFMTYLVPRATRVVSWRAGGLMCLSGYAGEISKFRLTFEESAFNKGLANWLKQELPDTVGNIYVDIKGTKVTFPEGKSTFEGDLTMHKYNLHGGAEARIEMDKNDNLKAVFTKAYLEKIPLPPILISNAVSGILLIINKNFPVILTRVAMEQKNVIIEGYGSKRLMTRIGRSSKELLQGEIKLEVISNPFEQIKLYRSIKERFPDSNFSPLPQNDEESLFLDFFTREWLYLSFKLLETVKDSKLDYKRSIRTLGKLTVQKKKFKVTYKERDIQLSLNRLIRIEYPWIVNNEYLFDIKGLRIHLSRDNGIVIDGKIDLGEVTAPEAVTVPNQVVTGKIDTALIMNKVKSIQIEGKANFEIDKESKIPRLVFREMLLNGKPFPIERLNLITQRSLNILKDGHIPFEVDDISIGNGIVAVKGLGAQDFTSKIFSDPYLFTIFEIRGWDLWAAGIKRFKEAFMGRGGTLYRERLESLVK